MTTPADDIDFIDLEEELEDYGPFEYDGQPNDHQENADFARDGYFENMECDEGGFWH